jgi:hypothetical protein
MQNTKTDTLETVGIPSHGKRIDEMDFLKAVFIILMITFHLTFIGNTYPYAKQLVYTFHVPAFLVISIVLIALDPVNLDRHTIAGAVMVYLVMSLCLFCFRYLRGRAEGSQSVYRAQHIGIARLFARLHSPHKTLSALSVACRRFGHPVYGRRRDIHRGRLLWHSLCHGLAASLPIFLRTGKGIEVIDN